MTGELYENIAPATVENFEKLANDGFYDGLIFHRVIPGFMIQGGCPDGTGMGGPGYSIKGEFTMNGHQNNLKHERGVLSMARTMDPDSAGSQFFIMTTTSPHTDISRRQRQLFLQAKTPLWQQQWALPRHTSRNQREPHRQPRLRHQPLRLHPNALP